MNFVINVLRFIKFFFFILIVLIVLWYFLLIVISLINFDGLLVLRLFCVFCFFLFLVWNNFGFMLNDFILSVSILFFLFVNLIVCWFKSVIFFNRYFFLILFFINLIYFLSSWNSFKFKNNMNVKLIKIIIIVVI